MIAAPVALLFPGGGTQYTGMGKALYESHKTVRELFEEANDVLGFNLRRTCFEGSASQLAMMKVAQPAIFTVSMAACNVWLETSGITPAFACGHSLGEMAALTAAGVFSFADALQLVQVRGALLTTAGEQRQAGMMAVNKVPSALVEAACVELNSKGAQVYVAVYNSPLQQVVSGNRNDMAILAQMLEQQGAETVLLQIDTPSHCPLLQTASAVFREKLSTCPTGHFSFPVIANVTAKPYEEGADVKEMLPRHMISPVRWAESIAYLERHGVANAIEMPPQAVLKQLTPYITNGIKVYGMDVAEDLLIC